MSSYLIADAETSGLFRYDQPADAPGQPRLAQIGLIFATPELEIEAEHEFMIKPVDWQMSEEAAGITGLTTEMLLEHGVDVTDPMKLYAAGIDADRVVCGHNVSFDVKMMRAELRRLGMDDRYIRTRTICTMQASRPICKLPSNKVPKLHEACEFFGIEQPQKHSALADARSALSLMRKLREIGALPFPRHPLDGKRKRGRERIS